MSLTVKKKLRSGVPVWMAYPRRIPLTRQLEGDIETDILIVGAGISGALIAYSLAKEGHRVVVIDAREHRSSAIRNRYSFDSPEARNRGAPSRACVVEIQRSA